MIFYTTGTGNIGVSIDEGATIINHQGRRLPLSPAMSRVWFESDEVEVADLTADCRAAVEALGQRLDDAADAVVEKREARERAEQERKERAARERAEREAAEAAWRNSPEGRAAQRRADERFARETRALLALVKQIQATL